MVGRDALLAVAGASDETVYQHARRGVIALVQQITVEEFLPTLVSVNLHSSCLYGLFAAVRIMDVVGRPSCRFT